MHTHAPRVSPLMDNILQSGFKFFFFQSRNKEVYNAPSNASWTLLTPMSITALGGHVTNTFKRVSPTKGNFTQPLPNIRGFIIYVSASLNHVF